MQRDATCWSQQLSANLGTGKTVGIVRFSSIWLRHRPKRSVKTRQMARCCKSVCHTAVAAAWFACTKQSRPEPAAEHCGCKAAAVTIRFELKRSKGSGIPRRCCRRLLPGAVQSVCNQTGLNTAKQPWQTAGPLQHDTVLIDQFAQDEAAEAVAKATKGYDTLAVGNRCGLRLVLSFSTVSVLWLQTPAYCMATSVQVLYNEANSIQVHQRGLQCDIAMYV